MVSKVEILMHPVRMKICVALMGHNEEGLTPLEMVKLIKDVSQATLYRHIQMMADDNIIHVIREKKVKSVTEKYYALNEAEAMIDENEWSKISKQEKLDYVSYYQLLFLSKYQSYLEKLEQRDKGEDASTFSLVDLKLDDE